MNELLCGIYCIENLINNKKYIGLSRDIRRRWLEHRSELSRGVHINTCLQKAWQKYGEKAFKFYIVELCDEKHLCERERYYIKTYNTLSHEQGYNLTTGGDGTAVGKPVISLLTRKIYAFVHDAAQDTGVADITMIDWCRQHRNFMYLDEFNNLSPTEQNYWANFNWTEFNHAKLSAAHSRDNLTTETLQKYSEATAGKNNPRAFAIYCPQLDEEFWGAKEAHDKYGICRSSISQCISGKIGHAGKHPVTGEPLTWQKIEK